MLSHYHLETEYSRIEILTANLYRIPQRILNSLLIRAFNTPLTLQPKPLRAPSDTIVFYRDSC